MARAAGNSNHYTFCLQDHKGKYHPKVKIELPSSTHIIKSTLAAPQLVQWAYRQTLDSVTGLLDAEAHEPHFDEEDTLMDTLVDADILDEWLKQNKMRPNDVRDEAGDRGHREHELLEKLGKIGLEDPEAASLYAHKALIKKPDSPWARGILDWWIERGPIVYASELLLVSPKHGFAGTVDLIWMDDDGKLVVTDLKTRKIGAEVYTSDMFQVDSYMLGYEEQEGRTPDRGSVLVVREDGTWIEKDVNIPRGAFLDLLKVYDIDQASRRRK